MAQYDNNNRFILAKNDRMRNEKDAPYTGQATIDGVEYWLNGWVQERKDGSGRFFSGTVRPKQARQEKSSKPLSEQISDEIPF